jgi:signal peptidase II
MIFIIISLIFCLDRLTKILVSKYLALHQSLPLVKGVFHFTLIHNRGAAFGMLKNQLFLLVFSAVVAITLIYADLKDNRVKKPFLYQLALGLIFAGALGNLIDRLFLGYVIDFLDFRIWPVFNIADSSITVGALLLGYSILKTSGTKSSKLLPHRQAGKAQS